MVGLQRISLSHQRTDKGAPQQKTNVRLAEVDNLKTRIRVVIPNAQGEARQRRRRRVLRLFSKPKRRRCTVLPVEELPVRTQNV
jgi:hypothetical protein